MTKLGVLLVSVFIAATGMAANTTWNGALNNDWSNSGNWTVGVPGLADTAYVNMGTPNITTTPGEIDNLYLGNATLDISAGFTVTNRIYMGDGSSAFDVATINQTGGDVVFGSDGASESAYFGRGLGQSVYNLSGGTLETKGSYDYFGSDLDGETSTFTFNQTGGTYTDIGKSLIMSAKATDTAIVNLSGGAVFNANAVNQGIRIGEKGTAIVNISGSSTVFSITAGESALGYYATVGSFLGTGNVNLTNGTFSASGSVFSIGRTGDGTLNQMGGTVNMDAGTTYVGRYGNSVGIINLSDGAFTASASLHVGYTDNAAGTINQTGGTVTMQAYSTLGTYAGSSGTINLDAGSIAVTGGGDYFIGRSGDGTINQTGGAFLANNTLSLGRYGSSVGTVNLSSGTFGTTGYGMYVGYDATGIFNQTGGDVDVAVLKLADNNAAATGLYSISGGTLNVSSYMKGGGQGNGVFEVVGSGATSIGVGEMYFYKDTFRVKLDENGSTLVRDVVNGNFGIELKDGILEVDTLAGFNGTAGDSYDLLWTADGFHTSGMTFVDNTGFGLQWQIVAKDGGEVLQVQIAGGSPVEIWAIGYGLSGDDAAATADPDNDGINNLYEYGLGGDPTNSADIGIVPVYGTLEDSGTNWFEYIYPRQSDVNSGLTYYLELTDDLIYTPWANSGYEQVGTGTIDSEFDAVTNRISTAITDERFIRLMIEEE